MERLPLEGIRVIDLTRAMAGPFCTMMLSDMGAEIIKIEPLNGDETRQWGPPFIGSESTYFLSVNRNKKSIAIDLRKEGGVKIVRRLAASCQVLVENYRPGTTDKLGINYEKLRKINGGLVYCSISGFGQDGPYKEKPGYDIIALATSGMMSITGEEGRPPVKMGVPVSDICAGMYAAFAISTFLLKQEIESKEKGDRKQGTQIDVSMLDGQISWLTHQAAAYFATGENPRPMGSAHPSIAPYQAFSGSNGEYFIVAVGNDELFGKFCQCVGANDLRADSRFGTNQSRVKNRSALEVELSKIFSSKTSDYWLERISSAGVPCAPINKLDTVFRDPQVISRKMVVDCEHPDLGKIKQLAVPYRYENTDFTIRSPPPLLGEHTKDILSNLGYSNSEINDLKSAKVVS